MFVRELRLAAETVHPYLGAFGVTQPLAIRLEAQSRELFLPPAELNPGSRP